jgi:hypothetical protein
MVGTVSDKMYDRDNDRICSKYRRKLRRYQSDAVRADSTATTRGLIELSCCCSDDTGFANLCHKIPDFTYLVLFTVVCYLNFIFNSVLFGDLRQNSNFHIM